MFIYTSVFYCVVRYLYRIPGNISLVAYIMRIMKEIKKVCSLAVGYNVVEAIFNLELVHVKQR